MRDSCGSPSQGLLPYHTTVDTKTMHQSRHTTLCRTWPIETRRQKEGSQQSAAHRTKHFMHGDKRACSCELSVKRMSALYVSQSYIAARRHEACTIKTKVRPNNSAQLSPIPTSACPAQLSLPNKKPSLVQFDPAPHNRCHGAPALRSSS